MARQNQVRYVNFYTAGSAAYKFEPESPQKKKVKLPKPRRQQKLLIYVDPVAVLGIVMAVVMLVMMLVGVVQFCSLQQKNQAMQTYISTLQAENARLQAEYEAGYDLEEIYEIATARGMIPAEQAQRVSIQVSVPQEVEELSAWENFCMFLAGLFA